MPYHFGIRIRGESKLDILIGLEYLQLLLDKLVGAYIPVRFVIFAGVGTVGVAAHLSVLYSLLTFGKTTFPVAQAAATICVMTLNFFLNNAITYRDRRLKGTRLLYGLLTFYAACSIGAFLNIRTASYALQIGLQWYAAGILGVALSSVWNYGVTAVFTWRQQRNSTQRRVAAIRKANDPASALAISNRS